LTVLEVGRLGAGRAGCVLQALHPTALLGLLRSRTLQQDAGRAEGDAAPVPFCQGLLSLSRKTTKTHRLP